MRRNHGGSLRWRSAECVMRNKGESVVEAVRFLDNILHRMGRHVVKKSALLGPLSRWAIGRNNDVIKGESKLVRRKIKT